MSGTGGRLLLAAYGSGYRANDRSADALVIRERRRRAYSRREQSQDQFRCSRCGKPLTSCMARGDATDCHYHTGVGRSTHTCTHSLCWTGGLIGWPCAASLCGQAPTCSTRSLAWRSGPAAGCQPPRWVVSAAGSIATCRCAATPTATAAAPPPSSTPPPPRRAHLFGSAPRHASRSALHAKTSNPSVHAL